MGLVVYLSFVTREDIFKHDYGRVLVISRLVVKWLLARYRRNWLLCGRRMLVVENCWFLCSTVKISTAL